MILPCVPCFHMGTVKALHVSLQQTLLPNIKLRHEHITSSLFRLEDIFMCFTTPVPYMYHVVDHLCFYLFSFCVVFVLFRAWEAKKLVLILGSPCCLKGLLRSQELSKSWVFVSCGHWYALEIFGSRR